MGLVSWKKCIYKLKDDNGEVVSNQADTLKEVHPYFY